MDYKNDEPCKKITYAEFHNIPPNQLLNSLRSILTDIKNLK
jgi:hypothetical protein